MLTGDKNSRNLMEKQLQAEEDDKDAVGLISVHAVTTRFKENTTAHGIPHVHNAQGTIKTIFWIIISLAATAGFCYNATLLINDYISFNTTTSVSILSESAVKLPAITFCNQNAIMESKLQANEDLRDIKQAFVGRRKKRDTQDVTNGRSKRSTAPFGSKTKNGQALDSQFEFQERIKDAVADIPLAEKMLMGHQLDDLIIQCKYNGYTCNITADFYQFYDPSYGNCYTYNWGRNGETLIVSHRPGATHGLSIVFNTYQNEYVGFLTESAGMRVMIHDQDIMPFPVDDGISASPGQQTNIGMRKVSLARMGGLYGDCISTATLDSSTNVYAESFGVKYSAKACQVTCYQKSLVSTCGCGDPNYPLEGEALGLGSGTVVACKSSNDTQEDCMDEVLTDWNDDKLGCSCPNPCNEDVFDTKVSVGMWPSDHYKLSLFGQLPKTPLLSSLAQSNDTDEYKRNLGKIVVYFEEFNYELIQEEVGYELFSLISDMGGILGLYIGFSLMTILEFFELAADLIFVGCIAGCGKKQGRTSPVSKA